jgi:hypothetical protein
MTSRGYQVSFDKNLPSFWVLNELIFIFASPSKKGIFPSKGKYGGEVPEWPKGTVC